MVLETIRGGEAGPCNWGQESQNYSSEVTRLEYTMIRWFSWWTGERFDQLPGGRSRAVFSQAKAKENYQAHVHTDQMVLVIVRQEARPVAWWPKTLKWGLGNNSRQPRDLTEKRQGDSLKQEHAYSYSWVDEEGDVAVDEDDGWEPSDCHRSMQQRFRVLTNCCLELK